MVKTEPIKHHYIPQFILRSFFGEDGLFYYWDNDNTNREYNKNKDAVIKALGIE